MASQAVTLPRAGRLLVLGRFTRSTNCSLGDVEYGLYVDGGTVPGSGVRQPDAHPEAQFSLQGVTEPLTAGAHTLEIKFDCISGNWMSSGFIGDEAITAVLIGS